MVRYRFALSGPTVPSVDVVLAPEGASFEIAGSSEPVVVFRCAPATYALVIFGRWKLPEVIENGKLTADGEQELIDEFVSGFVGG